MSKVYYLYRHIRLDKNQVFYVGIGTVPSDNILNKIGKTYKGFYRRAFETSKSRNPYWKNIINKTTYEVEIVLESNDIKFIKNKEIEFIKLYKDTLSNMTSGGGGIESYKHTQETKKKIGNAFRGKKLSKEHNRKVTLAKYKPIIMYNDTEKYEFKCITDCAVFLGNVNCRSNISSIIHGKGTRKSVRGYQFKLK